MVSSNARQVESKQVWAILSMMENYRVERLMMSKERLTYVVLGLFLILSGLTAFIPGMGAFGIVMAILALAAGVLILIAKPGISSSAGWIVAAVYFILLGLQALLSFGFSWQGILLGLLALVAGIVLVVKAPAFQKHIGFFLFVVWLLLNGVMSLFGLGVLSTVTAVVAIVSGVLMLLNQ